MKAREVQRKRVRDSREAQVSTSKRLKLSWLYLRDEVPEEEPQNKPEIQALLRTKPTRLHDYWPVKVKLKEPVRPRAGIKTTTRSQQGKFKKD